MFNFKSFITVGTMLLASSAFAQNNNKPPPPPPGECTGGLCGAPNQSGGGCGCGCGCSILINFTDQGDTYQYADDFDDDAIEDDFDNCPFTFNSTQIDSDGDGHGDDCDNCPSIANTGLADTDADLLGDLCDDDADADTLINELDNCVFVPNLGQQNADSEIDGFGNACDENDDGDSCDDALDKCPLIFAINCQDDQGIERNACFPDDDADNIEDLFDNCPAVVNPDQADSDNDGPLLADGRAGGDVCDRDADNDGVDNTFDNCANVPNLDQSDIDKDFRGDACDPTLCFMITDEASCLDPSAPFAVHAGKTIQTETGKEKLLHIFANRESRAIRYQWTVIETPDDGADAWTIINPQGSVSVSSSVEYIYEPDHEARFSTRVPGIYKLRLTGELVHEDDYAVRVNQADLEIRVEGEPIPAGCSSTSPSTTATGIAALGLVALISRRRRRAA
jgi:MYXO-CTERM domain-containing protein